MKNLPVKNLQRVIIDPGEYYVSAKPEVISTLLGSCVAACLFDPVNRVFGMNHFLLAYRQHSQHIPIIQSEEGRYGIYAMELREGSQHERTVGDVNVEVIKAFLANEKIPLISSSLGGMHGRNVHFVGTDYSVYIKKIGESQDRLLEKQERRYWRKHIAEHEQSKNTAEFW